MAKAATDPMQPLRTMAASLPDVSESTSCNQAAFKVGKKAFLYTGPQGDRHKAMFKLDASMPEAQSLAEDDPDRFATGSTGWVTAWFMSGKPMPKRLWSKWLKESYELATGASGGEKANPMKASSKKVTRKKA